MKQLRVYQLALEFHRAADQLKTKGEIRDQLHRASMSVVLNIAEHYGKPSKKDRLRFLDIAFGSVRESQACLDILGDVAPATLVATLDLLAASMWKFIQVQR